MNKRKLLLVALSLCMVAILAMGGTLAYLTDTDNQVNTFTVGKVKIVQNEEDREDQPYVNDKKLFPIVDDVTDDDGYHQGKNYVDKMVSVTVDANSEDVYVRTYLAIPAALDDGPTTFDAGKNILHWNAASANYDKKIATHGMSDKVDGNYWYWGTDLSTDWPGNAGAWNGYYTEIKGVGYNVYVVTHSKKLVAGDTTAPSLLGVYLDKKVNVGEDGKYFLDENGTKTPINFNLNEKFDVLVMTEAVQATGFDNAIYALDSAFGYVGEHDPFNGTNIKVFPATEAATAAAKAAK